MSLLDIFRKNTNTALQEMLSEHEMLNRDLRNLKKLETMLQVEEVDGEHDAAENKLLPIVKSVQEWKYEQKCLAGEGNILGISPNVCVNPLEKYKGFRSHIESTVKSVTNFTNEEKELAKHLFDEVDLTCEVGFAKLLMRLTTNNDHYSTRFTSRKSMRQIEKALGIASNMGKSDDEINEIEKNILHSLKHRDDDYEYTSDIYCPASLINAINDFGDAVNQCIYRVEQRIEANLDKRDFTMA